MGWRSQKPQYAGPHRRVGQEHDQDWGCNHRQRSSNQERNELPPSDQGCAAGRARDVESLVRETVVGPESLLLSTVLPNSVINIRNLTECARMRHPLISGLAAQVLVLPA